MLHGVNEVVVMTLTPCTLSRNLARLRKCSSVRLCGASIDARSAVLTEAPLTSSQHGNSGNLEHFSKLYGAENRDRGPGRR